MIKAIVFDFDGVLVNTYESHFQIFNKKYNLNRELHKRLFEGNVHEKRAKLEIKDSDISTFNLLQKNLSKRKIKKDILNVLKELKKDYLLFIVSSNKEIILKEFLYKQKLQNLFEDIFGFETEIKKDEKFGLLLKKYKLNKNEVIFVTDTLGDILEVKKLKIKTIAVDFGFHEKERLEKGEPLAIISSFEEISEIIKKLNK